MGTTEKTIIFILVLIVLVAFIFLAWYFLHRARHKERIMLMERSIDFDKLKEERTFNIPWLKLGIIVLGTSIGLLIISFLANNNLLAVLAPCLFPLLGFAAGYP